MVTDHLRILMRLPPKALSPNARGHWAKRGRAYRRYKEDACLLALAAQGGPAGRREWRRARVVCHFFYRVRRRRDGDNLIASMKAAFDGLEAAGVIRNDSGLIQTPPRITIDPRRRPGVEIELNEAHPHGR